MKIKTSELIGPTLDWAVAKSADRKITYDGIAHWVDDADDCAPIGAAWKSTGRPCGYSPSTNWAQGGPIVEREGISLLYLYVTDNPFRWAATQKPTIKKVKPESLYGPTLLIAGLRCYVASKLGDEVEIPEELCSPSS